MNIKNYKNLKKNKANFEPLTPIDFLKRSAKVFPNYISIICMCCISYYIATIITLLTNIIY